MSALAYSLTALTWAFAGFAALSLAMDRHRREAAVGIDASLRVPGPKVLRAGGYLALVVSLTICAAYGGWAMGAPAWAGAMTVAAIGVVLVITYRAAWLVYAGFAAVLVGGAALVTLLALN